MNYPIKRNSTLEQKKNKGIMVSQLTKIPTLFLFGGRNQRNTQNAALNVDIF